MSEFCFLDSFCQVVLLVIWWELASQTEWPSLKRTNFRGTLANCYGPKFVWQSSILQVFLQVLLDTSKTCRMWMFVILHRKLFHGVECAVACFPYLTPVHGGDLRRPFMLKDNVPERWRAPAPVTLVDMTMIQSGLLTRWLGLQDRRLDSDLQWVVALRRQKISFRLSNWMRRRMCWNAWLRRSTPFLPPSCCGDQIMVPTVASKTCLHPPPQR